MPASPPTLWSRIAQFVAAPLSTVFAMLLVADLLFASPNLPGILCVAGICGVIAPGKQTLVESLIWVIIHVPLAVVAWYFLDGSQLWVQLFLTSFGSVGLGSIVGAVAYCE